MMAQGKGRNPFYHRVGMDVVYQLVESFHIPWDSSAGLGTR